MSETRCQALGRLIKHVFVGPADVTLCADVLIGLELQQAGCWDRPRRIVAKVEWHRGELFPRMGLLVTHLRRSPRRVVKFYNGRGTAEQWIKEGKNAVK